MSKNISIIAAMDLNRGIGHRGLIPWNLPEDMQRFKRITFGHTVIMGRKTYESVGHPLSGRENIVISSTLKDQRVKKVPDLTSAICYASGKIFIIGGGRVYEEGLNYAQNMFITYIHDVYDADTYFPWFDCRLWNKEVVERHQEYSFINFQRK